MFETVEHLVNIILDCSSINAPHIFLTGVLLLQLPEIGWITSLGCKLGRPYLKRIFKTKDEITKFYLFNEEAGNLPGNI